ncbi:MAG TPA: hypothetical protein DCY88_17485 [Cyanobacteria bacterium UBA11372]|nr:hypothetical protein [Cyanobacteria bacterium UBA11372]
MTLTKSYQSHPISSAMRSLIHTLNGRWHKLAMQIFMIVIISHLLEHIAQVFQLWVLGWKRPDCMGLLGLVYPWMMKTEWLHYGHALFMLVGLALLRPSIVGQARIWWDTAFVIQFWHHIEHALLLGQSLIHHNFNDFAAPVSIAQLVAQQLSGQPPVGQPWLPRIELHLFYNLIVLIPMLIALYYHRFPPANKEIV